MDSLLAKSNYVLTKEYVSKRPKKKKNALSPAFIIRNHRLKTITK